MHLLPTTAYPVRDLPATLAFDCMRRTAACSLHELPEDVLHAIMRHLRGNEAVKLATLHPALRRALGTLPSLHPSVVLDVSVIRDGACTRGEHAARQRRQRRRESFGAFRATHPGIAIEAVTVRMELPEVLPRHVDKDAVFDIYWLPLRPLRRLCVVTDALASGLAQVSKPFQCRCNVLTCLRVDAAQCWILHRPSRLVRRTRCRRCRGRVFGSYSWPALLWRMSRWRSTTAAYWAGLRSSSIRSGICS